MVEELKWVHGMIRRDLQTVREMAADTAVGLPAERIQARLRTLAAGGPLWQLKINCLQYCRFVHSHHQAESVMLFPALRQANPARDDRHQPGRPGDPAPCRAGVRPDAPRMPAGSAHAGRADLLTRVLRRVADS